MSFSQVPTVNGNLPGCPSLTRPTSISAEPEINLLLPQYPPTYIVESPIALAREDTTARLYQALRDFLHAPATMEAYRVSLVNFTRICCFTFPRLAVTILSERAHSAQARLLHLFDEGCFGSRPEVPTASAFCQARVKIQPEFFREWAEVGTRFYYANYNEDGFAPTWNGHFLWAVDATMVTLPDTPGTRATFGIHENQYPGCGTVQAQASFLYDVLAEMPVHVELGRQQAEKNFLFHGHARYLHAGVISLYDMGYADSAVVAALRALPGDFVIRCPLKQSFKAVLDFARSTATDAVVSIAVGKKQRDLVNAHNLPREVTVRLVKVCRPDGTFEVLMTSLLDREAFPAANFQEVYDARWGVETVFNRFKHQLEVECFSSGKVANIAQDFFSAVFLQVVEAVTSRIGDFVIRELNASKYLLYEYKVRKAATYEWLARHFVTMFLAGVNAMKRFLETFQNHLHRLTSPIRPNRHFPRPDLTPTQRLNYHLYRK